MKDYQKRLCGEYLEVRRKELDLFNFLLKKELGLVNKPVTCPINVLRKQLEVMKAYADVLYLRLECEGVDVKKLKID